MAKVNFRDLKSFFRKMLESRSIWAKLFKLLLLLLPVFAFGMGLLRTGNNLAPGDADYYTQLYEASRRSILEFHQFPWWNPWVSGGVPLFANPQFGPISIQMITTLLFGSIFGYKLALVIYLALGFFGMRYLLTQVYRADKLHAALLSYIWVFSSFFVYRIGGHFTFFVIGLVPWMIYFFIKRAEKRNWLWFALIASALIWSSMHYTSILAFLIIGLFGLGDLFEALMSYKKERRKANILPYLIRKLSIKRLVYATAVIALLVLPRVYATLEYSSDYPRVQNYIQEETVSVDVTWYALFGPDQYGNPPTYGDWGWAEIATYIGVLTFFVLLISLVIFCQQSNIRRWRASWLLVIIVFCLLLARADFASWAPFTLFRELPVLSSMRVATRWIAWAAFFILLFIGSVKIDNKKLHKLVSLMLIVTVFELFIAGFPNLNNAYVLRAKEQADSAAVFSQRRHWNNKRQGVSYDENLTEATRNNIGQIIAGDSLIDTRAAVKTVRCDDEKDFGCDFISNNAVIESWSPHRISIRRIDSGLIILNMNAGKYWAINGAYPFANQKVVDPSLPFVIEDSAKEIILEYKPRMSPLDLSRRIFDKLSN